MLAASASIVIGLIWDISWHRTIGRDTFWSPPHVIEQIGAIVAGLSCGYVVLRTTFAGSPEDRSKSVRFWKFFQGPLGAWICIWGSFAMLTSAPFDNWWHNAYGLDVEILSPPHVVLGVGMIGIQIGAMLMVLAQQNRRGEASGALPWMFAYCAGIALLMVATLVWEYTGFANAMHGSLFYRISALAFPSFMIAPALAARLRWPATTVALVYMGLTLAMAWILPSFHATPRLAPIYNPVTYMQPPTFPLLLVVPALAFDLLLRRARGWAGRARDWRLAAVLGVVFVVLLIAVQWPFAEFLLTPAARNRFFVADHWSYSSVLGPWRYDWWYLDRDAHGHWSAAKFWSGMALAVVLATVSARIGIARGRWMHGVQR